MITFVYRTDEHVKHKAPSSRTDDYFETCVDKLTQIGEIAREVEADAVLDGGDFFDISIARQNPHWMVRRVIELHKDYPCPVFENPGNHDFPYSAVDYVQQQPLGVLFEAGVFGRMEDLRFEDDDGLVVRVVGIPYTRGLTVDDIEVNRGDEDYLIYCLHAYASMEGGPIYSGEEFALSYRDLAELDVDGWLFGHWHIDQGIQWVDDTWFVNLGSMTRGSLIKDNLQRIPKVAVIRLWEGENGIATAVDARELNCAPADEIFDIEAHEEREQEQRDMEEFLETLATAADESDEEDLEGFIDELDEEDWGGKVKERALEYLGRVRAGKGV